MVSKSYFIPGSGHFAYQINQAINLCPLLKNLSISPEDLDNFSHSLRGIDNRFKIKKSDGGYLQTRLCGLLLRMRGKWMDDAYLNEIGRVNGSGMSALRQKLWKKVYDQMDELIAAGRGKDLKQFVFFDEDNSTRPLLSIVKRGEFKEKVTIGLIEKALTGLNIYKNLRDEPDRDLILGALNAASVGAFFDNMRYLIETLWEQAIRIVFNNDLHYFSDELMIHDVFFQLGDKLHMSLEDRFEKLFEIDLFTDYLEVQKEAGQPLRHDGEDLENIIMENNDRIYKSIEEVRKTVIELL